MMGQYRNLGNYIQFDNGYKVFFEAAGVAPYCLFVHIWHEGNKIPFEQFMPNTAGGFCQAGEFAKLLYKVSRAIKPAELELDEDEDE